MTRYTVTAIDDNRAILRAHLDCYPVAEAGEEVEFWAPSGGGYVRAIGPEAPGALGSQVCEGLDSRGSALTWAPGGAPLAATIRREARRALRAEARRAARR